MDVAKKRRPAEIARGLFLLAHPGPVFFHIVAVTLCTFVAAWPHFAWSRMALLIAAHTAMQLAIAILNDYCDREQDKGSKKPKPIPLGLIHAHEALILGILFIALMLLLLWPLNGMALLISLLYLALGLSYNLGLKATPLSGIVFALFIPLIPIYAFAGMDHLPLWLLWLIPVAAVLGITLNLANSLPDLEEDRQQGVHTLAVALGVTGTFVACPLLLLLSMLLIGLLASTHVVPAQPWLLIPTLLIALAALGALPLLSGPHRPISSRKRYFYALVMICLLLAAGWLIGALI
ncbi:hypothetical protein EPA93_27270 [Ktedonosporobacter rubrisoli]|uniref:Ubiquinone biosynthesis protein UbiA n=1 Tax=Ktedonosporobacter rubrisoli TaxID=2509675 RepID=A0A4P6JVU8_KTERU|nr:UbiA family prenyltransferase [Ktedonosporobacter rubrisoli]QBD79480.1 hypothetical protein EPA93_27270 [Ktedonosporobacter rubrisoli]